MRSERGITIVELLIAGAILVTILGALGGILVSTSRAYEANRSVTSASGQLRSAIQAIQYDVSLAGFCGVTSGCTIADALGMQVVEEDGVRRVLALESTYRETRYTDSMSPERVRYELDQGRLLRSVGGGEPSAIADGIESLDLLGFRSRTDATPQLRYYRPADGELSGMDLRINYVLDGVPASETFSITLQNYL